MQNGLNNCARIIYPFVTSIGCVILRDTRIVIPAVLRNQFLALVHESHPGVIVMEHRLCTKN